MRRGRLLRRAGRAATACVVALALPLAAAGCTKQRYWGGSASAGSDGQAKIGLVTKTDTNPFFVTMRTAAQKRAAEHGAQLEALAGAFDGDNDGQVRAIENLMQQGVDTILITPNSGKGVLDAIDRARQRGILVVALDTETDPPDAVDATYATDNVAAGERQGQYLRAVVGSGPAKVLMVDGTAGSTVDNQRHSGFLKGFGLTDKAPEIVGRTNADGDQNTAQQGVENLLQRARDVNVVYTMNEPMARGAYAALSGRGIADQVQTGSIDGGCEGVHNVRDGQYAATVMQFPTRMAERGVDAGVEYAKSGKKPKGFINTGSALITDQPMDGVPSQTTDWGLKHCWGGES